MFAFLTIAALHAEEPSGDSTVTVRIDSEQTGVTVAQVLSRGVASSSSGAVATAMAYKDICMAPCEFQAEPGLQEYFVYGSGYRSTTQRFDIRGDEVSLNADMGSRWLYYGGYALLAGGLAAGTAGIMGATLNCTVDAQSPECLAAKDDKPLLLGVGVVGVGASIPLFLRSRSHLEQSR